MEHINQLLNERIAQLSSSAEKLLDVTKDIGHDKLEVTIMELLKQLESPFTFVIVGEVKAYKPADKFKLMAEKNPALLEFKKRFDLDIEY